MKFFLPLSLRKRKNKGGYQRCIDMNKPIPGYKGLYEITDKGVITNITSGKVLKGNVLENGTRMVHLTKGRRSWYTRVARLLAMAFLEKPTDASKKFVVLIDGDESNLTSKNVAWANMTDLKTTYFRGKHKRKPVEQLDSETGEVIARFDSISDAAKAMYVVTGRITACCRGYRNCKHAYGYKWRYAK